MRYTVIYHYDVWGNVQDGWEVNDSSRAGEIETEKDTSEEVWNALLAAGIAKGSFSDTEFSYNGAGWDISDGRDGCPTFSVEEIDE